MSKGTFKVRLIAIVFGLVIMVSYQNCGVNYTTNQPDYFTKKANDLGFAYEAAFDQVAYMSCAEQKDIPNDEGVFFTFRMGAYRAGSGLRLTPSFFDYAKKFNDKEKVQLLSSSSLNANSRLMFSIRRRGDYQSMYINQSGAAGGTPEIDYSYEFGVLGTESMSASLIQLPSQEYMRNWAGAGIDRDAIMEGTLTFNDSETLAANLRQFMQREGAIVLGYSEVHDYHLRGPVSTTTGIATGEVYGTGASVAFKQPSPSLYFQNVSGFTYSGSTLPNVPARLLRSITEVPVAGSSGQVGGSWSCSDNMSYIIVRPQDAITTANGTLCKMQGDETYTNIDATTKAIVRKSLKTGDWWIDWDNKCIVPKKFQNGSCYGKNQTTSDPRQVNYDFTAECSPDAEKKRADGSTIKVCPHFASICIRKL